MYDSLCTDTVHAGEQTLITAQLPHKSLGCVITRTAADEWGAPIFSKKYGEHTATRLSPLAT